MADDPTPTAPSAALASQARALWTRLPRRARLGAIGVVVAVLGLVAWLTLGTTTPGWRPLAQQLSGQDASELVAVLGSHGIPSRLGDGGKTVEVPASRLAEAQVTAASAGLPRGGVGFEVFEQTSLGMSSFGEQVKYRRALQGELARSIASLGPVESARVHVALGKRAVFKDADEPPSASVAVRLRAGQRLSGDQVLGIKRLVAASVDGLPATSVVVIDQDGNVLDGDEAKPGSDQGAIETAIAARVRAMLERVVGEGRVAVVATATMDLRRVSQSEELYDKDRTAVRSESIVGGASNPAATTGGIAGVKGNLPGAQATGGAAGAAGGAPLSETRNYEVSRIVRQVDEPEARVARLHLAILIDSQAKGAEAAKLPELEALARQAAGLDDSRGDKLELRAIPFATGDEAATPTTSARPATFQLPVPLPVAIGAGAGLLVLIAAVVTFVVIRRRRRKQAEATPVIALPASVSEVERALTGEPGALPSGAPALPGSTLEERVLTAVRGDVPRAARVLASWLTQPDVQTSKP